MDEDDPYVGREQTLVKHFILRQYLSRFSRIVLLSNWSSVTYVDCFSGPWNVHTDDLHDTSFTIALEELRRTRADVRSRDRDVRLRCFFLERAKEPYLRLRAYADKVADAEVETKNAVLEESVGAILDFVRRGGRKTVPFIFIDPTGWTGFAMETLAPLLRLEPGEALINLMTKDVRRFIESPEQQTQASFDRLFGRSGVKAKVAGLQGLDRDDAVVEEYATSAREAGGFRYVCPAVVLHPERDRAHFHLIYATRHRKGVEVFKEAERKAMEVQEAARARAQDRSRRESSGMSSLFEAEEMHSSAHYELLRDRYVARSRAMVQGVLEARKCVLYDDLWDLALSQPMTWERDIKNWIRQWIESGRIEPEGWRPKQKVPHRDKGNLLVWQ